MPKPSPSLYPPYFQRYIDMVPEEDLAAAFKKQLPVIINFLNSIPEEKAGYAYAEGKWTLKELLQHIIDTERVFNYRSLCFARGEKASLPPFEEDEYAAASNADRRSWQSLVNEFIAVRKATEMLFESFAPEVLHCTGTSNSKLFTVDSVGFMTIGHFYHHKKVIEERYL